LKDDVSDKKFKGQQNKCLKEIFDLVFKKI
jgi:hypothetical protein